jgi:pimeloyl-ACP methyl ester carboxylesterase
MGGIVAMEMVRQAPGRIERLALLDSNHHADPASRFDIRNRQIADVRAGRLAQVVDAELMPTYFADANEGDPVLMALVRDMAATLGPAMFESQSVALRDRPDQSETLRRYRGPTLLLCGEEDRLCPPSRHEEMAMLLENAELEIVGQAGHLPTIERPEIVTAALRRWLSRSPRLPT